MDSAVQPTRPQDDGDGARLPAHLDAWPRRPADAHADSELLLANEQVVPGLGIEGTMIAAWNAARIVGKGDARRDAFRRGIFRWR